MSSIHKSLFFLFFCTVLCIIFCSCKTGSKKQVDEFTVSLNSVQVVIGEIEAQFMKPMSRNLRKENITVIYFPQEDAVCLRYVLDFITYHQFWSRNGRLEFNKALTQYNEDYNERTLVNSRRSRQTYGTVQGYLIWQQFNFSVQARANMNVDLGFDFREKLPYFTVNQGEAEYINPNIPRNNRTSPVMPLFFTRAQAGQLAELFESHYLRSIVVPDVRPPLDRTDIGRDDDY